SEHGLPDALGGQSPDLQHVVDSQLAGPAAGRALDHCRVRDAVDRSCPHVLEEAPAGVSGHGQDDEHGVWYLELTVRKLYLGTLTEARMLALTRELLATFLAPG